MATYEETYEKLTELQHMMGAMRRRAKEAGPQFDASRGRVLALLKMRDGLSTRDMADVLDIRLAELNETIARMEAEDLVERRQSEEDGRIMLLFLTDAGREANQPKLDLPRQLLSDFTDDEIQALNDYLDRMSAKLLEELGEDWKEHDKPKQRMDGRDNRRGSREGREGREDRRGGRGFGDRRDGDRDHGYGYRRGGGRSYRDDRRDGKRDGGSRYGKGDHQSRAKRPGYGRDRDDR